MSTNSTPPPGGVRRLVRRGEAFLSDPASPRPLAALRIGLALVLLGQALALSPGLLELYGPRGFVQWPIVHELAVPGVPRIDWMVGALAPYGVRAETCVQGVFLVYVAGLSCLLVGWHTRLAAIVAWLTHLMLNVSGGASIYGVDAFANIALFYCLWMPVGHAASLDRLAGRVGGESSFAARLSLRVLQLHLCIVYLSAGLEKVVGEQWRSGEAIWLAVMQPALGQFDFTWLAWVPWLALVACWGTIVVELGYPIFIWPARTRRLWAMATIGLHLGIAVTLGLVSFSALLIVLNVSGFLVSPVSGPRPEVERDQTRKNDFPKEQVQGVCPGRCPEGVEDPGPDDSAGTWFARSPTDPEHPRRTRMNTTKRNVAAGVFDTSRQAEIAVEELRRAGFSDEQIGIAGRNMDANTDVAGSQVEEGAVAGAVGGGAIGALGGIAVATGVISPIGPAVAGGLLAGLLASTAVGAAAGGVLGALIGMGIPEEEARYYESELAAGRPLITVRADGRYDEAMAILRRNGAHDTVPQRPVDVPPAPIL